MLLASSLLVGACGDAAPTPELTIAQSEHLLTQQENELRDFWRTQGVGIEATKLALVSDTQTASCEVPVNGVNEKKEVLGSSPAAMRYCESSDEITVGKGAIRFITQLTRESGVPTANALAIIAAHETGHAVQKRLYTTVGLTTEVELQADCLAGKSLAATNSSALVSVRALFSALGPDFGHGTVNQRVASFHKGATTGKC